jgi:ribose transport system substrate-binding protein
MLKKMLTIVLGLAMMIGVAGCTAKVPVTSGSQSSAITSGSEAKEYTIGVSLYYRRDEFYKDLETGMINKAAELGVTLVIQDADTDPAKQTDQFESFMSTKVDAIAAAITDPEGLIPTVLSAGKAGIPVFAFDGGTKDNEGITSFIGMDNYQAGVIAGEWAKSYIEENLDGTANVVILDFPISAVVCVARVNGFKSVIEKMPNVKVVAQQDGKASRTDSMTVMENILQVNAKVDMVFGINDDTCFGAISALEAAKRENVAVVSVGWSQELFEKLEANDKYFKASAVQNPATMGAAAIQTIYDYLTTGTSPKEVLDKAVLVTSETIKDYDWRSVVEKRAK